MINGGVAGGGRPLGVGLLLSNDGGGLGLRTIGGSATITVEQRREREQNEEKAKAGGSSTRRTSPHISSRRAMPARVES